MTREEAVYRLNALLTMCDFRDAFGDRVDSKLYEDAVAMAIEALKAQSITLDNIFNAYENGYQQGKFEAQEWIPCSERLPKEEERVLVCSDKGDIEISMGCMFDSTGEFEWYTSGWKFGTVVAWMPLPPVWKGE